MEQHAWSAGTGLHDREQVSVGFGAGKLNGGQPRGRTEVSRRDSHAGAQDGWVRARPIATQCNHSNQMRADSPRASQVYMWRVVNSELRAFIDNELEVLVGRSRLEGPDL